MFVSQDDIRLNAFLNIKHNKFGYKKSSKCIAICLIEIESLKYLFKYKKLNLLQDECSDIHLRTRTMTVEFN